MAFGVGALVEQAARVLAILKWAGAVYLVYLGVQAIRHRDSMARALAERVTPVPPLRAMGDGFVVGATNPKTVVGATNPKTVVGATNPKTIVSFAITLPEFITGGPGHLPVPVQMLVLGALFPAIALILDAVWAVAAGTVRDWFARSPRRLAMIGGTGGLAMIGLGIGIAATGRND